MAWRGGALRGACGPILLGLVRVVPSFALECDPAALCPNDPCTIAQSRRFEPDCTLDFGSKDVTVAATARLAWSTPDTRAVIHARNLTLEGSITGVVGYVAISVDEDFRMQRPGVIGMRTKELYGRTAIRIEAGGSVVLAGSLVSVTGGNSYVEVRAADITVDTPITTAGRNEDGASIYLLAYTGSITTRKLLSARGLGIDAGGFITLEAAGDIVVGGPVRITGGPYSGYPGELFLEADGDVMLSKATVTSPNNGGGVDIAAGGDVTVGDIRARGRAPHGYFGEGYGDGGQVLVSPGPLGTLRITGLVDVSCVGGAECYAGYLGLGAGCYTDLTGATLLARGSFGSLGLGCACAHTDAECDGGCTGLDATRLDPPLATELLPCP